MVREAVGRAVRVYLTPNTMVSLIIPSEGDWKYFESFTTLVRKPCKRVTEVVHDLKPEPAAREA